MIDLSTRVLRLARALPEGERAVIDLTFNLTNVEPYDTQEIARLLRLTRERVRQHRKRGLHLIWLALADETVEPETIDEMLIASRMRERAGLLDGAGGGDFAGG